MNRILIAALMVSLIVWFLALWGALSLSKQIADNAPLW